MASVDAYKFSASNVFARMQQGSLGVETAFNRDHSFSILDHQPISRGHALLIVKDPAATLLEPVPHLPDAIVDLQVLARAVQAATGAPGIRVHQNNGPAAGQCVPQLHFHVVPCYGTKHSQASKEDRPPLDPADQGVLMAAIRNALPADYAPGFHIYIPDAAAMEAFGATLQQHFSAPGTVVHLHGELGAGKSTIARGFVRAFCRDPFLNVPSPTFLLCLSYQEDGAAPEAHGAGLGAATTVHHMDPYRLGQKVDKMAGLIDFPSAFRNDVCVMEWPDLMPKSVRELPQTGLAVRIGGIGIQSAGRLVRVEALQPGGDVASVLAAWRRSGKAPETAPMQYSARDDGGTSAGGGGTGATCLLPRRGAAGVPHSLPASVDEWLVLGIESSCDDTAAAVVRGDGTILSHEIASQVGLHEQYGGVKPDVARDAHARAIQSTVDSCLAKAGVSAGQLTAVAVTIGPGLSLCLQVGTRHALQIAASHQLPFVPVHHMEAHALMTRLPSVNERPMQFPALLLLVSGGHNMLILSQGVGRHRIIGTTLDDSAGECFDKTARVLGVTAIPGGPHLERLAAAGDAARFKQRLTMPMQNGAQRTSCNFSFSGLKTGVKELFEAEAAALVGAPPPKYRRNNPVAPAAAAAPPAVAAPAAATTVSAVADSAAMEVDGTGGTTSDAAGGTSGTGRTSDGAGGTSGTVGTSGMSEGAKKEVDDSALDAAREKLKQDVAAVFQEVVVRFLQQRTRRALEWLKEDALQDGDCAPTCLVVAGGVAANQAVRTGLEDVAKEFGLPCVCPPIKYCTDNGLMVAWTGVERLRLGLFQRPPSSLADVESNVDVLARWPMGPSDPRSMGDAGVKYSKILRR